MALQRFRKSPDGAHAALTRNGTESQSRDILASRPFAALINEEIVIPSETSHYFAVERQFLVSCLRPYLESIFVDEDWYLQRYPDVKDAVQRELCLGARDHYENFGYFEHRMPFLIEVDEDWYLREYPDVHQAVLGRVYDCGQTHFMEIGFREGRLPFPGFTLARTSKPSVAS